MWFPYSLPVRWRVESDPDHIQASQADETRREFLIGFYLNNPITREWQVELQLMEPYWTQVIEPGGGISVGYYPSTSGQLAEIICRIEELNCAAAVRRCYAYVSRTLSYWSALKGRAFAILGFKVADLRNDAKWRAMPHRPSTLGFDLPPRETLPETYWTITALYREARNSASDIYRFLCCHRILRMWASGIDPFGQKQGRTCELRTDHGNEAHFRVDRLMLVLSGLIHYSPELEGLSFVDLLEPLTPWHHWSLRAVSGEELPDRLDDYEHCRELSSVANLVDLVVHHILVGEINSLQSRRNAAVS